MRSPLPRSSLSPRRLIEPNHDEDQHYHRHQEDDVASTTSNNSTKSRKSCIPQPRASLSPFAAPSWNTGAVGEQNSNVRVVARIRPSNHCKDSIRAIFAVDHNEDDENIDPNRQMIMRPIQAMKSPPPGSSNSEGVANIAARFNTLPSSPIAPDLDLPSIITTPTKFLKGNNRSPSRYSGGSRDSGFKTPIHTNVDSTHQRQPKRSNLIPSNSTRQSFIQPPSSPSSLSVSSCNQTKRASHQTIAAGLTDPKHFDFDAVSFIISVVFEPFFLYF